MPVGCPNCGTQNPDGSQFCQNCRTPLMAGPAAPPPMAAPPPPAYGAPPPAYGAPPPAYGAPPPAYGAPPPAYAAPGGYAPAYGAPAASPYYTPGGAPPPVHRTPTGLIIGAGVAAFVILAILAVVGAFLFGNKGGSQHVPQPPPTSAPPTIAPTTAPTSTPSSTPGNKPTPTATTTPEPTTKPTASAGAIDTNTFTLGLAPGFKKVKSDSVTALVANDTGSIYVGAGKQDHESSVQSEFTGIVDNLKQKYSQVSECTKPVDFTIDGIKGTSWGFNYLYTPQGGQAVKVCDLFFIAVPDTDKTLFYEVEEFMADSDFDKFVNGSAIPELKTLRWKL